jgi:hypothetical protein
MQALTENLAEAIVGDIPETWFEMRKRKMAHFRYYGISMCKACVSGDCSVCEEPCPCVHHDLAME